MSEDISPELIGSLTEAQRRIIDESMAQSENDTPFLCFKHLAERTGLDVAMVRDAVRDLASKGIMRFERGLMTEDGQPYGSGYALTDCLGLSLRRQMRALKPSPEHVCDIQEQG